MQNLWRSAVVVLALGALSMGAARAQDRFSTEIQLAVDTSRVKAETLRKADEDRIVAALKKRLTLFTRTGEGSVAVEGLSAIRVRVPVDRVTPAQLTALARTAMLEIRNMEELRTSQNPRGRYELNTISISGGGKEEGSIRFWDKQDNRPVKPAEFLAKSPLLASTPDIRADGAQMVTGNGYTAVRIQFNDAATRRLEGFLKRPGQMLAVALDGEIITMAPTVEREGKREKKKRDKSEPKSKPEDEPKQVPQLDIVGGFNTAEEAAVLAALFNAGSLPTPLKVVQSRIIAE